MPATCFATSWMFYPAFISAGAKWRVWQDIKLPEGRILMPGVISHATDVVEHPDYVAERLVWAKLEAMAEGARRASRTLWGE